MVFIEQERVCKSLAVRNKCASVMDIVCDLVECSGQGDQLRSNVGIVKIAHRLGRCEPTQRGVIVVPAGF